MLNFSSLSTLLRHLSEFTVNRKAMKKFDDISWLVESIKHTQRSHDTFYLLLPSDAAADKSKQASSAHDDKIHLLILVLFHFFFIRLFFS